MFVNTLQQAYEAEKLVRDGTRDLLRMSRILDNERVPATLFPQSEYLTIPALRSSCWWMKARSGDTKPI